jgi:alanyl-tRNA synthetase
VFDSTPFYAEGGGQVSDVGEIAGDGLLLKVTHVSKVRNVIVHTATVVHGIITVNDEVLCKVDPVLRNKTARNHTATHMLHKALQMTLGSHVRQAGSSVDATSLRFDFTHFEAVSKEQLSEIESIVNEQIDAFLTVNTAELPLDEAKKRGITALFEEKYGDMVRVVEIGAIIAEHCGGTHVINSGEIGALKIISESSVGSGIRRIEAVTGTGILAPLMSAENIISELSDIFKAKPEILVDKATNVLNEMKSMKQEFDKVKQDSIGDEAANLLRDGIKFGEKKLVYSISDTLGIPEMRKLADELKAKESSLVIVLVSTASAKATIIVSISDNLLESGLHAGKIVKELSQVIGGGGGGKADMAQAGGNEIGNVADILPKAKEILTAQP